MLIQAGADPKGGVKGVRTPPPFLEILKQYSYLLYNSIDLEEQVKVPYVYTLSFLSLRRLRLKLSRKKNILLCTRAVFIRRLMFQIIKNGDELTIPYIDFG